MQKLPIGITTFNKIIRDNYSYVDKTGSIAQLVGGGSYYFLSRPRRFGKSLLLDTFREAFEGNKVLFEGLALSSSWDWNTTYPVISIDFAKGVCRNRQELDTRIAALLSTNERRLGVASGDGLDVATRFSELIRQVSDSHGSEVVLLVDEYDKPILDTISEPSVASEIREGLRNFYSIVKSHDAHLKFVLLTGVTKFSKVSIFSGLNNLKDITLDSRYGSVCGYTEQELLHVFGDRLKDVDLEQVRQWYNGYNWLGEKVYNPYDILLFLDTGKQFRSYWFETGTPQFLVELFKSKQYYLPDLDGVEMSLHQLGDFDVDRLRLETILFQTGYLTIRDVVQPFTEPIFLLGFPNKEVRSSFNQMLLEQYFLESMPERLPVLQALSVNDYDTIRVRLESLFAGIAHDNYRKNSLAAYEGFYASVVFAFFSSLDVEVTAEDVTNRGRIDLTLQFNDQQGKSCVAIFEFKVTDTEKPSSTAMKQLRDRNYHEKFRAAAEKIYLIGIEFSKTSRTISGFEVEQVV